MHRVGILHPEDAYGEAMRDLFASALASHGAAVVAVTGYPADTIDFSGPASALVRASAGGPGGPGGLDAIFVPDTYRVVGLAAPALAAADLRGVRLLGTSGWDDPRVVAVGREHVEGAVFTGAVVRSTSSPMLRQFAEHFEAGFGKPPGPLAAQGFDATLLVLRELVAGHETREALRAGLLAAGPLSGASGGIEFQGDGNARRRPHLLGIEGGQIVDLDSLGRAPALPAPVPEVLPAPDATAAPAAGAGDALER